jgi:hypothetical protein
MMEIHRTWQETSSWNEREIEMSDKKNVLTIGLEPALFDFQLPTLPSTPAGLSHFAVRDYREVNKN